MKFSLRFFLLIVLCTSMMVPANYANLPQKNSVLEWVDNLPMAGKVALGVGVLAVVGNGIYGIYKLVGKSGFFMSDEEVLKDGIDALEKAHKFDSMITFIGSKFSSIPDNEDDRQRMIESASENLLSAYARPNGARTGVNDMIREMDYAIPSIKSAHAMLAKRIAKLRNNNGDVGMINDMQQAYQEITALLPKLEFAHEYLKYHKSYYQLLEWEGSISSRYRYELDLIKQYDAGRATYDDVVNAVCARARAHGSKYPYMNFFNAAQYDRSSLSGNIDACVGYPNRMSAAKKLLSPLQKICSIVSSTARYHQEVQEYQAEQREIQRRAEEKAKAEAQARQVADLQRQVWTLQQQQNQLLARQK